MHGAFTLLSGILVVRALDKGNGGAWIVLGLKLVAMHGRLQVEARIFTGLVAKWRVGALAANRRSAQKISGKSQEPGAVSSLG